MLVFKEPSNENINTLWRKNVLKIYMQKLLVKTKLQRLIQEENENKGNKESDVRLMAKICCLTVLREASCL